MNENQQAAYIMAQAAGLNAEVAGMQAENATRAACEQCPRYGEREFKAVLNKYCIDHNQVIGYFRS